MGRRCGGLLLVAPLLWPVAAVSYASPAEAQAGPTCRGVPATIVGTPGHHDIVGTAGDDVIVGRRGNDHIRGARRRRSDLWWPEARQGRRRGPRSRSPRRRSWRRHARRGTRRRRAPGRDGRGPTHRTPGRGRPCSGTPTRTACEVDRAATS